MKLIIFAVLAWFTFMAWKFNIFAGIGAATVLIGAVIFLELPGMLMLRASRKYAQGEIDAALELFEKAYRTGRMNPEYKIYYGYMALRHGKLEKAEQLFDEVGKNPKNSALKHQLQNNYALLLWKKGELDKAIELLEDNIKESPSTIAYGSLGYLLIEKGDFKKALDFNLKAYEYNDSDASILDNLGETYFRLGDIENALIYSKRAVEAKPNSPAPYYNYALALLASGDKEEGLYQLHRALRHRFTFLSPISREDVLNKIREVENGQIR